MGGVGAAEQRVCRELQLCRVGGMSCGRYVVWRELQVCRVWEVCRVGGMSCGRYVVWEVCRVGVLGREWQAGRGCEHGACAVVFDGSSSEAAHEAAHHAPSN